MRVLLLTADGPDLYANCIGAQPGEPPEQHALAVAHVLDGDPLHAQPLAQPAAQTLPPQKKPQQKRLRRRQQQSRSRGHSCWSGWKATT